MIGIALYQKSKIFIIKPRKCQKEGKNYTQIHVTQNTTGLDTISLVPFSFFCTYFFLQGCNKTNCKILHLA